MREKHGVHFGLMSMVNHWFVAFTFIGVLSLGFYLEFVGEGRGPGGPMMGVHKAAGVLVLVLATWRLLWRLYNGFPEETIEMPTWQALSAKLVHWLLLFATIAMPVSGILMSIYGDRAINVFGLFVISTLPENELINRFSDTFHWALAYMVGAAICMHVGAVLQHHFIIKDDTLARMTKRAKPQKKSKRLRTDRSRPGGDRTARTR